MATESLPKPPIGSAAAIATDKTYWDAECIRVTPALYTDEAHLDRLVEALAIITGTSRLAPRR